MKKFLLLSVGLLQITCSIPPEKWLMGTCTPANTKLHCEALSGNKCLSVYETGTVKGKGVWKEIYTPEQLKVFGGGK